MTLLAFAWIENSISSLDSLLPHPLSWLWGCLTSKFPAVNKTFLQILASLSLNSLSSFPETNTNSLDYHEQNERRGRESLSHLLLTWTLSVCKKSVSEEYPENSCFISRCSSIIPHFSLHFTHSLHRTVIQNFLFRHFSDSRFFIYPIIVSQAVNVRNEMSDLWTYIIEFQVWKEKKKMDKESKGVRHECLTAFLFSCLLPSLSFSPSIPWQYYFCCVA